MFGLGRYLYSLPSLWVEYDAPNQRWTEKSKARLYGIIAQHYQRFLHDANPEPAAAILDAAAAEAPAPPAPAATPAGADNPFADLRDELKKTGKELFPTEWETVESWFITRWTTKNTPAQVRSLSADLTPTELEAVLAALVEHAPLVHTEWQKSKEDPFGRAGNPSNLSSTRGFRAHNSHITLWPCSRLFVASFLC